MSFVQIIYEDNDGNDITEETNLAMAPLLLEEEEETNANNAQAFIENSPVEERQSLAPKDVLIEWGSRDTNYLLKKYNKYIPFVGRRKRFKTKRDMWTRIGQDLKNDLHFDRTPFQCENRYKTVLRRWRKNSGKTESQVLQTGNLKRSTSNTIQHSNNTFISIKPDPLTHVSGPSPEIPTTSHLLQNHEEGEEETKELTAVLWDIFKKKEEGRERRHKEKMEVIWTLLRELDSN